MVFLNEWRAGGGEGRWIRGVAEYKGANDDQRGLAMFRMLIGQPTVEPGFPRDRFIGRGYQGLESIVLRMGGKSLAVPVDDRVATQVPLALIHT